MINHRSQKGQAIILLAFAMVGLVGFAALAIDGGRVLSDKRHAQNAADTAALAAALEIVHGGNNTSVEQKALDRALSNGYDNDATLQDVEVHRPPIDGPYVGNNQYVQVIIRSTIQTTFARVIGRPEVTNTVQAVARAQGVTSNPLVDGAALAAYKKDGTPFNGGGGGDLNIYGSGVYSNSTDTDCPNGSMSMGGSIDYHVDTSFASAGSVCTNGAASLDGTQQPGQPQVEAPQFDITAPSFSCGGVPPSPNPIGNVYQPGTYNGLNTPPGNFSFAPGNYCFNGNVKFNGGNITANNVNFRMSSGAFTIGSTTQFTCSNMIIHVSGGTGVAMTGGGNNCSGITFYMETGDIQLNGNTTNIFTAPTTSGDYTGLLIYMPEGNHGTITINGTSNSQYTGSIIGLSSAVTINGNSDSAGYNVQVLANTIDLGGTSNINIHYNPNELYTMPKKPTIALPQ